MDLGIWIRAKIECEDEEVHLCASEFFSVVWEGSGRGDCGCYGYDTPFLGSYSCFLAFEIQKWCFGIVALVSVLFALTQEEEVS